MWHLQNEFMHMHAKRSVRRSSNPLHPDARAMHASIHHHSCVQVDGPRAAVVDGRLTLHRADTVFERPQPHGAAARPVGQTHGARTAGGAAAATAGVHGRRRATTVGESQLAGTHGVFLSSQVPIRPTTSGAGSGRTASGSTTQSQHQGIGGRPSTAPGQRQLTQQHQLPARRPTETRAPHTTARSAEIAEPAVWTCSFCT